MNCTNKIWRSEQLENLGSMDSPAIANVIELFGCRSDVAGYTEGLIKAIHPDF